MESRELVSPSLGAHRDLKAHHPGVGLALQSYLRRTVADVHGLPERSTVRLVKGAYLEPPDVAFPDRRDVDRNFARVFATLMSLVHFFFLMIRRPPRSTRFPFSPAAPTDRV